MKPEEVDFTALKSARVINEIDKITDLDLSYKYRLILIENIIENWREDDALDMTSESQGGKN